MTTTLLKKRLSPDRLKTSVRSFGREDPHDIVIEGWSYLRGQGTSPEGRSSRGCRLHNGYHFNDEELDMDRLDKLPAALKGWI